MDKRIAAAATMERAAPKIAEEPQILPGRVRSLYLQVSPTVTLLIA